jgi:4-aminobutyrate aminotransferase-like enzyme
VATEEVAKATPAPTISTFGGNPVSTTAALAVLEFIEQNDLRRNAKETGAHLRDGLEALAEKYTLIGDVRGMGLMQAMELVTDRKTKDPATAETGRLLEAAKRNQLLVGKGGLYGNVIRVTPALNASRADVDEFLRRMDKSFAEITQ